MTRVTAVTLLESAQYQDDAAATFAAVAAQVAAIVPQARIEHIGASSIPGAVSKGDLDICVLVPPQDHAPGVAALEAAGCSAKADTLRAPDLCMLLWPGTTMDVALQVVACGSRFECFLHFRDALRADSALVAEYNRLKQRFASEGMDRYREEKARFITQVLRAAGKPLAAD